jgi:hypothetical protein
LDYFSGVGSEGLIELKNKFKGLIERVKTLKDQDGHSERDNESLVESFYELLGYKRNNQIRFRTGHVDVLIQSEGEPKIVNEVKRRWGLHRGEKNVLRQAFGYASINAAPLVVITNGDYYALYNQEREGLGVEAKFEGEFYLSDLKEQDIKIIEILKKFSDTEEP